MTTPITPDDRDVRPGFEVPAVFTATHPGGFLWPKPPVFGQDVGLFMHSKTPPRNRLAKVLPEEWRKYLVEQGCPKRKYTAVCRATLVGGRFIEELIIEEGWIIATNRTGLGGVFEQRIDFDPRQITSLELVQVV